MKYLKYFERLEEYPLEIGDYVKVDEEMWKWIDAGIYGKINAKIFEIIGVDSSDDTYLLNVIQDWVRRNQLEKATPEEIKLQKLQDTTNKYNI